MPKYYADFSPLPFSAELAASGLERPQVKNRQDCCLIYQILPMILLDSIKQTYSMGIILTLYQLSIKKNIHTRYIFSFSSRFMSRCPLRLGKSRVPPGFVYFLHSLPPSLIRSSGN